MAKFTNRKGVEIEVPDGSVAADRMEKDPDRYTPVAAPKPKAAKKPSKAAAAE